MIEITDRKAQMIVAYLVAVARLNSGVRRELAYAMAAVELPSSATLADIDALAAQLRAELKPVSRSEGAKEAQAA